MIGNKKTNNSRFFFRIPIIMLLFIFFAIMSVHAQNDNAAIESYFGNGEDDFQSLLEDLTTRGVAAFDSAAVMTAMMGNKWSDSYIGPVISPIPHFGIGLTLGSSFRSTGSLGEAVDPKGLFSLLGFDELEEAAGEIGGSYFIPGYSLDVRIGGIEAVPFDVGFKVGYFPLFGELEDGDLQGNYFLVGGDIRYQLVKPSFEFVPEISAGVGYSFLRYDLNFIGTNNLVGTNSSGAVLTNAGYTNQEAYPYAWIELDTHVLEFMVQGGWNFLGVIKPYLGASAYFSDTTLASTAGIDLRDVEDRIEIREEDTVGTPLGLRVFGGLGFALAWFNAQFGLSYHPEDTVVGMSTGFRVQL